MHAYLRDMLRGFHGLLMVVVLAFTPVANASNHPQLIVSTDTIDFGNAAIGDTIVISFEALAMNLDGIETRTTAPFGIRRGLTPNADSIFYPKGVSDTLRAFILVNFYPSEEITYQSLLQVRSGDSTRFVVLKGRGRGFAEIHPTKEAPSYFYNGKELTVSNPRVSTAMIANIAGQIVKQERLTDGRVALTDVPGPCFVILRDRGGQILARIKIAR